MNYNSNLNASIMLSFNGKVNEAIEVTNYQWLLFYPCVYVFAMWDAVREAKGENPPFYYLPFVLGAYLGTVGIIYSRSLTIFTILLGPVFLGIIFFVSGIFLGNSIRYILNKKTFKYSSIIRDCKILNNNDLKFPNSNGQSFQDHIMNGVEKRY